MVYEIYDWISHELSHFVSRITYNMRTHICEDIYNVRITNHIQLSLLLIIVIAQISTQKFPTMVLLITY